jgi:hypothetical protein
LRWEGIEFFEMRKGGLGGWSLVIQEEKELEIR